MSEAQRAGSPSRRWLASVALVCASLLFGLVVMELGWRVYLHQTGRGFFDDNRDFISPWFTMWDEPFPVITTDTLYYRSGRIAVAKPDNEIRVISFGGSTTANLRAGVSYPELLEQRFAAAGNPYVVRVMNAGSEGFSTAHTLVNLALRNLDARPDIITVYENINDLSAAWFGEVRSDYSNKYLHPAYLALRHRTGVVAGIARSSRLARYLFSRIGAIAYPSHASDGTADHSQTLEYFRRNLRNIISLARANGIRPVLVTQPASSAFRDHPGFAAFTRATREIAAQEGAELIDLAAQITSDSYFLDDAIHNNREGVEAVTAALYEPLSALIEQVADDRGLRGAPVSSDTQ